jgi:DNA polymerase-3 subunit epsilon
MTRLILLDTETTGVDVHEDRIVTAFLGVMHADGSIEPQRHFLIDPQVEIPEGASAVHGITTEKARAEGEQPKAALQMIRAIIVSECVHLGAPLVAFNAAFDVSILAAELDRWGIEPIDWQQVNVIDPLVIDRKLEKFRRGSGARKLGNLAPAYGIAVDETRTHAADYDCYLAGRIALRQMDDVRLRRLAGGDLAALHAAQVSWAKEQAADLQKWFRTKGGKPDETVDGRWPLRERTAA